MHLYVYMHTVVREEPVTDSGVTMTASRPSAARGSSPLQKIFVAVAAIHAVLIFVQPVLAGMSLDGNSTALDLHYWNGMTIMTVAVVQVVSALLWWKPGGGPTKAITLSVLLLGLEVAQFLLGDAGNLAIHLPLGIITLFGTAGVVMMARRATSTKA